MILQSALVVAAVAVLSALLVFAPRVWLGRAMLGWAVSPLVAYAGVVAWDAVTRPGDPLSFNNVILGLSLLSAILVIPWAITCAAGFAIGFGLRRLVRRTGNPPTDPRPGRGTPRRPATAPQPSTALSEASSDKGAGDGVDWREAHLGFESDGLKIDGVDVWGHPWVRADTPALQLAHPAYPEQMHRFTVQDIDAGGVRIRFAVSELSNGVWGFYVPRQRPFEIGAVSPDGSLRYAQRRAEPVQGSPSRAMGWAILTDVATGRVLADCAAWSESRITANPDGGLFLRLRREDGEALFRIDPIARTFKNQGERGQDRPLHQLADAISEFLPTRSDRPRSPHYRRISPDGSIRVDTTAVEWGNSHWVHTPRVIDLASGRVILDLDNTDWDATIDWPGPRRVSLDFRRYHFSGDLTIELDLARETYRITREPGAGSDLASGPLGDAESAMEASGRRVAAFAAIHGAGRPIWADESKLGRFAAWRTALVILGVASVLTAVATAISVASAP